VGVRRDTNTLTEILTEKAISINCNIKRKDRRRCEINLYFPFRIIDYNNYIEQDTV
jgi:hypothetical protein